VTPRAPIHPAAARGFALAADAYERGRPGYPKAAIDQLAAALGLEPGRRVLDLGAGTGKLTRQIAGLGASILAVEPVAAMRERIPPSPLVTAVNGTAEAIPLADGSIDAAVVGQAFHWFDGNRALAELARVVRPGGGLGLLWNVRDASVAWVAELDELIDRLAADEPRYRSGRWRDAFLRQDHFSVPARKSFLHAQRTTVPGIADRVASISYVAAAPDAARAAVLADVQRLAEGQADRDGHVELPHRCDVWLSRRRSADR
jgi:SAM-dependent methyltransferase